MTLYIALTNHYKPKINSLSEKLAKYRTSEKKGNNVWQYLYNLDKEIQEKRDQVFIANKMKEEEIILRECTFKPEKCSCDNLDININPEGDIYERSLRWKQNIEDK